MRPGASRTRVGGRYDGPYGPALIVAVTAPPVDGRATAAVCAALAEALGLKPRDVRVKAGAASRDKLLIVTRAPDDLAARVASLRDGAP